ncbi:serine protease [Dorea sp. D27]|nr:patatin family protein [Dorea sp. D27]KMZ55064.1 serine protease [Dorea sp. D27]
MKKATIVLEGGATRGVFTSGALDYLMEMDVYLSHVIGVSAGACNGVDYVSRQPGRTRDCMIHKEKEYDYYYGFTKFIKEKSLLDMDMVFDKYPNEIFPFDFDTYFASDMECEIVTTNCVTGKAEYMKEDKDRERLMKLCRASSSMPLVSPIVNIDGIPYLDGGLADSIPVKRAVELGNEKIVLMLTRNPGYRKKMTSKALANVYRRAYRKYPNLVRTTIRRNFEYNKAMRLVEEMEEEGKIFVLRPLIPTVSRLEKTTTRLWNSISTAINS